MPAKTKKRGNNEDSIYHYKLKDLRPEHLQALYNSKHESGLSLSTIKHIHVILHSGFKL